MSTFRGGVLGKKRFVDILISRVRFRAKVLAGWAVLTGILGTAALVVFGFLACPRLEVADLAADCSAACGCGEVEFSPTCSMDGRTLYFSPCHAGCGARTRAEAVYVYEDCACVLAESARTNLTQESVTPWWRTEDAASLPSPAAAAPASLVSGAVEGFCPSEDCDGVFLMTMMFVGLVSLLGSTARVGNSIINLRVVEPQVSPGPPLASVTPHPSDLRTKLRASRSSSPHSRCSRSSPPRWCTAPSWVRRQQATCPAACHVSVLQTARAWCGARCAAR